MNDHSNARKKAIKIADQLSKIVKEDLRLAKKHKRLPSFNDSYINKLNAIIAEFPEDGDEMTMALVRQWKHHVKAISQDFIDSTKNENN